MDSKIREKIVKLQAQRSKLLEEIEQKQAKADTLLQEIDALEAAEINKIVKELDIPIEDLKKVLQSGLSAKS